VRIEAPDRARVDREPGKLVPIWPQRVNVAVVGREHQVEPVAAAEVRVGGRAGDLGAVVQGGVADERQIVAHADRAAILALQPVGVDYPEPEADRVLLGASGLERRDRWVVVERGWDLARVERAEPAGD